MCARWTALIAGFLALVGPSCTNSDNLVLLLDTLRPIHRSVCDEDMVSLACPRGTSISIQVAQYGGDPPKDLPCATVANNTCKLSNKVQYLLLQRVVEECQKKPSCVFSTNPGEDDPCPRSRKYVEVSYKCRPYEFRSINGCDDQVVKVSCNPHTRIAILNVQYGRTQYESVTCPQPAGVPDETCSTPYAAETVMRICQGKRRCQFTANRKTFQTSCQPFSRPYVKVIYACVPLGVLTERYESAADNDEDGLSITEDTVDETVNRGEKFREPNPIPPIADPALQPPTESTRTTTERDVSLHTRNNEVKTESSINFYVYIGAGIILLIIVIATATAIYCYNTQQAKEKAKNGNMFTTEAPNVFSDTISDMDNDVDISHISGTFYDPVHPDMILYRDADGTRNTLRAMRPLSTVYPCASANMYGNADYVPQPRELGRFTRSKSNEEEVEPDMMTSPKSIGAYSTSRFYYG